MGNIFSSFRLNDFPERDDPIHCRMAALRRPDGDCWSLLQVGCGRQWLWCATTAELHELAHYPGDPWYLLYDDDGHPYVACTRESTYVFDVVRFVLFIRVADGAVTVCERSDGAGEWVERSMDEFSSFNTPARVGISVAGGSPFESKLWVYKLSTGGCRIWWSLPKLVSSTLQPHRGGRKRNRQTGRVVGSRITAMRNWCDAMAVPRPQGAVPRVMAPEEVTSIYL